MHGVVAEFVKLIEEHSPLALATVKLNHIVRTHMNNANTLCSAGVHFEDCARNEETGRYGWVRVVGTMNSSGQIDYLPSSFIKTHASYSRSASTASDNWHHLCSMCTTSAPFNM